MGIRVLASMALFAAAMVCGCQHQAGKPERAPVAAEPAAMEIPPSAQPDARLADLAFLAGRWVCVNPNKTVNEETWSPAMGNHMVALFRQIRRDGQPALIEVSLITAEPGGVMLRLRHLHSALEVPDNQREVSVFRLESAVQQRAAFAGTGAAQQVQRVEYALASPSTLTMSVEFAPGSGERGYTLTYARQNP